MNRFRFAASAAIVVLTLAVSVRGAAPAPAATQLPPIVLPEGDARDLVKRLCEECHSLQSLVARRRLPSEWREVLDKMYSQGMAATDDEDAKVVIYINANFGKIDPNKGTAKELMSVLEISQTQADAVIAARPIAAVEDLAKIPGFDEKKIAAIRDRLVF
ncbi:MAG: hypothetical protein EPO35_04470 [Acidobacteria bacterium]|nr:MAG: hypothetical protein EPO35_04470 [Acidobacteriota bacterium]